MMRIGSGSVENSCSTPGAPDRNPIVPDATPVETGEIEIAGRRYITPRRSCPTGSRHERPRPSVTLVINPTVTEVQDERPRSGSAGKP